MREALRNVLNKIVVPTNDRLEGVMVSKLGKGNTYVITYLMNDRIEYSDAFKIESETRSLFNMLAPDVKEDFMVQYKMVGND